MKNLRNILVTAFIVVLVLVIHSCTGADEYLKFTEGGEISYTGKIDSLKFFPGRNRVKIEGLIISDPKVSELRIYWNNKKDSAVVPINRTGGIDVVSKIIDNLPENIYNFEVRTFDAKGNSSIPVTTSVEIYGDRYESSLINSKFVTNNVIVGSSLTVNFESVSTKSGIVGSEIEYTTVSDIKKTVFVDVNTTSFVINDFKNGSTYRYRTLYKPVANAIDSFHALSYKDGPIPSIVLKNAKKPFVASSISGRWGILAEWNTNAAIKNHGGYGGFDAGCCGKDNAATINLESGWGAPAIVNGKIYQFVTVKPATYQLKVNVFESNYDINDPGGTFFVVAKGDGLPNVESITIAPEVLTYKRVLSHGIGSTDYVLEFTVNQTTTISVGILSSQPDWGRFGTYKSFELVVK